jgi:hypothetical protein
MSSVFPIRHNSSPEHITRIAYRLKQVSEITGLSVSLLRKEIRNGNLKAHYKGRCVLAFASDLDDYLNK